MAMEDPNTSLPLTPQDAVLDAKGYIFSDETIDSLKELGTVLRGIHDRLISEGYLIQGGKIFKDGILQA